MLKPGERSLLLSELEPPPGCDLSLAVGTTYSLDLLALLTTPVAFTLFDQESIQSDPLGLLHTMREYAGRIRIFCQAGQIKIPNQHQILYSYLEDSVFEVTPPDEQGVFHPKVWALRYDDGEDFVLYRLLVLSRNLTFDRSWDTSLVLEGELTDRENRISSNYPLGDFFSALPEMCLHPVSDQVNVEIDNLVEEIQRVDWDLPRPFTEHRFWALGLPHQRRKRPFEGRIDRMLVLSPFLSDSYLKELKELCSERVLISRTESFEDMNPTLFAEFDQVFALDPNLSSEVEKEEEEQDLLEEVPFTGLHAKLFIGDQGWDARLWSGSANATRAAFYHNVEFLVELKGKKSQMGIDTLLQESEEGQVSFRDMLHEVNEPGTHSKQDQLRQRMEESLRHGRQAVVRAGFRLRVDEQEDGRYGLILSCPDPLRLPEGIRLWAWPITLDEERSKMEINQGEVEEILGPCSFAALSSFLAFELSLEMEGETLRSRFVLNLPLSGLPENRQEMLLQTLLEDRGQVLRYLLMMLQGASEPDTGDGQPLMSLGRIGSEGGWSGGVDFPLLETMILALSRDPKQLDRVFKLVEDLRKADKADQLLPDHFEEIWGPIWAARQSLQEEE